MRRRSCELSAGGGAQNQRSVQIHLIFIMAVASKYPVRPERTLRSRVGSVGSKLPMAIANEEPPCSFARDAKLFSRAAFGRSESSNLSILLPRPEVLARTQAHAKLRFVTSEALAVGQVTWWSPTSSRYWSAARLRRQHRGELEAHRKSTKGFALPSSGVASVRSSRLRPRR